MTLGELITAYGKRWLISPGLGGGYYAIRRDGLSPQAEAQGLSMVRAGATVTELASHLAAETERERRRIPTP